MKKITPFYFILFVITVFALISSCKKDSFITSGDALINITTDSLKYDTVFTTTGSITKSFKIINENNQKLKLSKVKLMGGSSSPYKMNVDGVATAEANDITVEANDSIYVFVSVLINPSAANLAFIVSDSILINYNGKNKFVQLQAFGQNAIFLRKKILTTNTTFTNTLPYVILDGLTVDNNVMLTIQQGTRMYLHANAPILVNGTLLVNGTKTDSVIFTGDRLDAAYKDLPASWPGIFFNDNSKNNVLKFAVLKNANQGIVVQKPSVNANPKVILQQCIIDNSFLEGIQCSNTSLQANNSLISNCGSNIDISLGGDYTFTNCTVAGYSNNFVTHKNAGLVLSNFTNTNTGIVTANLNATFTNNIFWGDGGLVYNEIEINKQGTNTFAVVLQNNLYRNATDPTNCTLTNNIKNIEPSFDTVDVTKNLYNFRITKNTQAAGINKGIFTTFTKDLDDKNRSVGLPDLGCYEKQ